MRYNLNDTDTAGKPPVWLRLIEDCPAKITESVSWMYVVDSLYYKWYTRPSNGTRDYAIGAFEFHDSFFYTVHKSHSNFSSNPSGYAIS